MNTHFLCLGIESTAHTFGVSVVRAQLREGSETAIVWEVLSNVRKPFVTKSGGMVPAQVSDHHVAVCGEALAEAFEGTGVTLKDIDLIAFSQGPGIGNCLRIGAAAARSLALQHGKPLIGVNHCIAHLEVGRQFSRMDDPLLLYASGANTQVIAYEAGRYRVLGETLDIGVGNLLDSVGRALGLGFPAGPAIEEAAKAGTYYPLPYSVKGMDVQFSGLESQLARDTAAGKAPEDICASLQETVFAMLCEVAERALAHTGKTQLVLGGGVACNARFQEMARIMCQERGATCFIPQREFLVDNAAMIAMAGVLMHTQGLVTPIAESMILPQQRTDDVVVTWR